MGTAVWAGRVDSRHTKPPVVICAQGLHQKTCRLPLEPPVSSGTPQTFPLIPRPPVPGPARLPAQPSPGHSFTPFPGPVPRGSPLLRAAGNKAGPGREGRAARGGSRDKTPALTLPRGPPAAGLCLQAFSPHALARRRREPARPMTRRAAAGRCLPGRAASGAKAPRLLRRQRHPSLGGSGEEKAESACRPRPALSPPPPPPGSPAARSVPRTRRPLLSGGDRAGCPSAHARRGRHFGGAGSYPAGAAAELAGPGSEAAASGCPLRRWLTSRCRGSSGSSRRC